MSVQAAFLAGVVVGALCIYLVLDMLPKAVPAVRWIIQAILVLALIYYVVASLAGWPLPFVT